LGGFVRVWSRCLLLSLSFCGLAETQAVALPPVEAFGAIPEISAPKLSPDGAHFAAIQSFNGMPALVIYAVGPSAGRPVIFPSSAEKIIDDFSWARSDRLIVVVKMNMKAGGDDRIRSWVRALSVSADGKDVAMLLKGSVTLNNNVYAADIVDFDLDDPDHIFGTLFVPTISGISLRPPSAEDDDTDFRLDVLKIDLHSGEGHYFMAGNYQTRQWYMDGHGNVVARLDRSTHPLTDHVKILEDGSWKETRTFDASGDNGAAIVGLSDDSKALVRLDRDDNAFAVLVRDELASSAESQMFGQPGYDVDRALTDEWTGHVVGAVYSDDKPEFRYFDPERTALQRGLEHVFPGLTVHAVSMSQDKSRVIVEVQGPRNPLTYYFLDRKTHQASIILTAYAHLTEADLGEMKPYPYAARDGLQIPAYLTLPPGKEPKNLPVVIMPHGGPDARDELGFDWWAQFLANRGYAVLQPNYRGSSGYGYKFTQAGLHEWGLKMQDDISDGAKKLIADGIADPKRICIVGASYGGYAALAGATLTPDLYACAMSFAGVSDLLAMLSTAKNDHPYAPDILSFWQSRIGSRDDQGDQLRATSPARHADQVRCPILLMHGEGDTTVRISQSEKMYDALKDAGKDVQFIRVPGEDHYLNFSETRIRMLTELEAFLKKNIGN